MATSSELKTKRINLDYRNINTLSAGQRYKPNNLKEELSFQDVLKNPKNGNVSQKLNKDPRFTTNGYTKYRQNINGIEFHYQYNAKTGAVLDLKIDKVKL